MTTIMTTQFRPELLAPLLRDLAVADKLGEIPARGTSMYPMLRDGDRVRLVPARAEEIRFGDIVVRMAASGPIIHRLVGWWWTRDGWRILTKGDNVQSFDPLLLADGLLARVRARVRNGEVKQLDGVGMRLRGRGRAAVSFVAGIMDEAWLRGRRAAPLWVGWREG
jgi:hypothetical protein